MAQEQQDNRESADDQGEQDRGLVGKVGPVEVDWPRTVGYFGGIGVAVALEMIEWPIALFIAAVPLVKMLNQPKAPLPLRFASHLYQGASIPVGGGAESTIRLPTSKGQQSAEEGQQPAQPRAAAAS